MEEIRGALEDGAKEFALYPLGKITKLLFLDFDGVLNVGKRSGTFPKGFFTPTNRFNTPNPDYDIELAAAYDWDYGPGFYEEPKSYQIVYSDALINGLNKILKDPRVQLVWLTTWKDSVGVPAERMGLEPYNPWLYLDWGIDDETQTGKVLALNNFLKAAEYRGVNLGSLRAAYVDDQTLSPYWLEEYASTSFIGGSPLDIVGKKLLICPTELYGISEAELRSLQEFFKG